MKIPFLNLFRKSATSAPAAAAAAPAPAPQPAVVEKSAGAARMKTVVPNAVRSAAPPDSFAVAAAAPATMPLGVAATAVMTAPAPSPLPTPARPTAAPIAKKAERSISLTLGEIVEHLPAGLIDRAKVDPNRRVSFPAAALEKGMATGQPASPLRGLFDQAPEIFARPLTSSDPLEFILPMTCVIEQFTKFQVRADQVRDASVPQFETPFLQVTLEDNRKFGIEAPPVVTVPPPPIRLQPATASALAAAEPEPAPKERPAPIRLEIPTPAEPAAPIGRTADAPIRLTPPIIDPLAQPVPPPIAFSLSPNGADVPEKTETVPASAEPSVPTSFTPAPARIPFKIALPTEDPGVALPTVAPAAAEPARVEPEPARVEPEPAPIRLTASSPKMSAPEGQTISLSLRTVMRSLPAFQLSGDPEEVDEDARLELPFALVQPQLVLGRVGIAPAVFEAALPEEYRDIFDANEATTVVTLPLQEVLQNLPGASLALRADQEEQETINLFETAFSQKAREDAERHQTAASPILQAVAAPEPAATPTPTPIPTPAAAAIPPIRLDFAPEPAAAKMEEPSPVLAAQSESGADAKTVVAQVTELPGVSACAIVFSDGLSLADNFPPALAADGFCAMGPSLLQRTSNFSAGTGLGPVDAITLFCRHTPVTFFMHENICLAILHASGDLSAATRASLTEATRGLARKYPQPA